MGFQVGDEVVCVDAADRVPRRALPRGRIWGAWDAPLVLGRHYIVRWAGSDPDFGAWLSVKLVGVREGIPEDYGLAADRFRKVNHKNIEIFRQMCASPKPLVPVGPLAGLVQEPNSFPFRKN